MAKEKKIGVKERIIEAASRLFYFEGYNQTGINQIIAEANVAKASMYQHFRSKEDIAVAYLERRHYLWMGWLEDYVKDKPCGHEKIIACFDFLDYWLCDVGFRGCGFQNIITDLPKDHQKIKDQVLSHKTQVREWIQECLDMETQYNTETAQELGDQVLVLIEGAIMLSQIQKESWPISTAKRACRSILSKI